MLKSYRESFNSYIIDNKKKVVDYYNQFYRRQEYQNKEVFVGTQTITTPIVLTKQQNRYISEQLNNVVDVLFRIPEISFRGDYEKYFNELGFEEDVKEVLHRYKHHRQHMNIMRPDCIYDGQSLKVLEFNISSSLGGIVRNDIMGSVIQKDFMLNNNLLSEDKSTFFYITESLVKLFRKTVPNKEKINLALLYRNRSYERIKSALMLLKALFEEAGTNVLLCDPTDLTYDEVLKLGDAVVDVAFRLFLWDFKEFGKESTIKPLIKAVEDNKVEFYIFAGSRMHSAKTNLALLSQLENSEVLSSRARNSIKSIIPWTRVLKDQQAYYMGQKIDLLEYLYKNKDKFIIKPSVSAGGMGVIIGKDVSIEQWMGAIEQSLNDSSAVVQEYHKAINIEFPIIDHDTGEVFMEGLQCVFSPFLIDGTVQGYNNRCQHNKGNNVINIGHGALPTGVVLI